MGTITEKQKQYLKDLIFRHPNFRKMYPFDSTHQEGFDGEMHLMQRENSIGKAEDFYVAWLNEKYHQYLNEPIEKLDDMDSEEASAIISHLKIGEEEREK